MHETYLQRSGMILIHNVFRLINNHLCRQLVYVYVAITIAHWDTCYCADSISSEVGDGFYVRLNAGASCAVGTCYSENYRNQIFSFLHHLLKNNGSQRFTNVLGVLRQLRELFLTVAINGKDTKRRGDNDVFLAFYEEKRSEFGNVIIKSE